MKVKVLQLEGRSGRAGRAGWEAWNAVASLRPGGVGIQIVSLFCGVLLPPPGPRHGPTLSPHVHILVVVMHNVEPWDLFLGTASVWVYPRCCRHCDKLKTDPGCS